MSIHRIAVEPHAVAETRYDLPPLQQVFEKYTNKPGNVIPLLQAAQVYFGFSLMEVFIANNALK